MKCDELKFERLGDANETYPASTLVIRKQFVDAAIDELKREHHRERHEYIEMVAQRESAIRKLKRALWMARAERAKERQNYESGCRSDGWVRRENMWLEVERLCRHKAEEYI